MSYNGDKDRGFHLDQFMARLLFNNFGVARDGVFVDVGAYHPIDLSNSYYFESQKNFKVICIEPNPVMYAELVKVRALVYNYAASSENKDGVPFQVVNGPWDGFGYAGSGMHTYEGVRGVTTAVHATKIEDVKVKARTLNFILTEAGVDKVDILSVDTEGHEREVLDGLDFALYSPRVCCIENYFNDGWLRPYMGLKGYDFVKRLHVDDFYIRIR